MLLTSENLIEFIMVPAFQDKDPLLGENEESMHTWFHPWEGEGSQPVPGTEAHVFFRTSGVFLMTVTHSYRAASRVGTGLAA